MNWITLEDVFTKLFDKLHLSMNAFYNTERKDPLDETQFYNRIELKNEPLDHPTECVKLYHNEQSRGYSANLFWNIVKEAFTEFRQEMHRQGVECLQLDEDASASMTYHSKKLKLLIPDVFSVTMSFTYRGEAVSDQFFEMDVNFRQSDKLLSRMLQEPFLAGFQNSKERMHVRLSGDPDWKLNADALCYRYFIKMALNELEMLVTKITPTDASLFLTRHTMLVERMLEIERDYLKIR